MSKAFVDTQSSFTACIDGKKIDSMKFVAACRSITGIYDALFMGVVAGQLKGDIASSSGHVEKAFLKDPIHCETLEGLIISELKHNGRHGVRGNKTCGVMGMLWAKRAINFIVMYLDLLGSRDDLTAPKCAQQTYEVVLMKYHGFFTSKAISLAMGLAPTKEDIFTKLGLKGDAKALIRDFVASLTPVIEEIQRLLDEHDCDFPDKV